MAIVTIKVFIPADSGGLSENLRDAHIVQAIAARRAGNQPELIGYRGTATIAAESLTGERAAKLFDYMIATGQPQTVQGFQASMVASGAYVSSPSFMTSFVDSGAAYFFGALVGGAVAGGFSGTTAAGSAATTVATQGAVGTIGAPTLGGLSATEAAVSAGLSGQAAVTTAAISAGGTTAAGVATGVASTATLVGGSMPVMGAVTGSVIGTTATVAAPAAASGIAGVSSSTIFDSLRNARDLVSNQSTGGNVGSIFDNLTGTISDLANTAVSAYGTISGVQMQKAQMDLQRAQTLSAMQPVNYAQPGGAMGGSTVLMMGLGMAALVAVLLLRR